jgi:FkbM family methyltransferase
LAVRTQCATQERLLRQMRRMGFAPRTIVDVGAYEGHWTRMALRIFPDANVIMIEAQDRKRPYLDRVVRDFPSVRYSISVLGGQTAPVRTFYEMETGSSLLPERSSVPRLARQVKTSTLDDVVAEPVDFMKLDVQGAELQILTGGRRALEHSSAVLLEVSFQAINEGAPLVIDVVEFMHNAGFRAYDIAGLIRKPIDDALWAADIMFVRESSFLLDNQRYD